MTNPAPKCRRCGYDLTGMRVEDRCPECSEPIWVQFAKNRFRESTTSDAALGSVLLGIFGCLFSPVYGVGGIVLGALGLFVSMRAKRQVEERRAAPSNRRIARAGWWLSLVSLILGIAVVVYLIVT